MDKKDIFIESDQVEKILFNLENQPKIRDIKPISSGLLNPAFLIEIGEGNDLILRILNSKNGKWKGKKESIVYRMLSEKGIPVPTILKVDTSESLIPYTYSISEKLSGNAFSEAYKNISHEDKLSIYKELGKYLGKIHSIKFEKFGDVEDLNGKITVGSALGFLNESPDINSGPYSTWKEMFREVIKSKLEQFKKTEFEEVSGLIADYFKSNESLIDYKITPKLLHLDLHKGNMFVDKDRITGIIDVEESLIGHNEYDLMRLELAHFKEGTEKFRLAFFEEYTKLVTLDEGYEERRPFYRFSRQLVHFICLVKYKESYSVNYKEDIKGEVEKIKSGNYI